MWGRDLELVKAETEAAADEAEAKAAAAEVKVRFRIEQANLPAKKELLSKLGSMVSG